MKIGYARVSTREQNLNLQIDALQKAGAERLYKEVVSRVSRRFVCKYTLRDITN